MNVLYYEDKIITDKTSIFLAGPTARAGRTPWRLETLATLSAKGFEGNVFIPEFENGNFAEGKKAKGWNGDEILCWESFGLEMSSAILFWMPFSDELPGLTTRAEFGYWVAKRPQKIALGIATGITSRMATGFIFHHASRNSVKVRHSLEDVAVDAIDIAIRERFRQEKGLI